MNRIFEKSLAILVLLVAVAFVFVGFNYLKAFQKAKYYRVIAEFEDSTQLQNGADIKIAGINVGRVVKKNLNYDKFTSVVEMDIEQNIKIPVDSLVSINSSSLLAASHLRILPGKAGEYMHNGAVFASAKSSASLEELIGRAIFTLSDAAK